MSTSIFINVVIIDYLFVTKKVFTTTNGYEIVRKLPIREAKARLRTDQPLGCPCWPPLLYPTSRIPSSPLTNNRFPTNLTLKPFSIPRRPKEYRNPCCNSVKWTNNKILPSNKVFKITGLLKPVCKFMRVVKHLGFLRTLYLHLIKY